MDVDDPFVRDPGDCRRMGCDCRSIPTAPEVDYGCLCPDCGATCLECVGFGYAAPPVRKFHQILSRVRGQIRRRTRVRGNPPGYVRLSEGEIGVILRKRTEEDEGHWIHEVVELGPPMRIFDVIVVRDRRKR